MLEKELNCLVTCVTNTPEQMAYLKSTKGKTDTHLIDMEKGIHLDRKWSIALMMESLEHICNKQELISSLNDKVETLIIRTSATRIVSNTSEPAFGGSMFMSNQQELIEILNQNSWRIESIRDTRHASWPTLLHWKYNLSEYFKDNIPPGNFKALDALCNLGLAKKNWWIWSSPLINIVAHRPIKK